jgi:hypothetical protein
VVPREEGEEAKEQEVSDNAYINDLETRLAEALATVEKCRQAAEDAIDNADRAMDKDESWARLHAGLRDVIAAAKGGGQ